MARTLLTGREALTLEVDLGLEAEAARRLLPDAFTPELDGDGRAQVALLCFAMDGLRPDGLALPGLSYGEVLWRLRARRDGQGVFFAFACDLSRPLVRALGAALIRYPVRAARVALVDGAAARIDAEGPRGRLLLSAAPGTVVPAVVPPRPVFTARGGRCFEVPWRETPTAARVEAALVVHDDSLARQTCGPVWWPAHAVLMRGRLHHCGFASAVG